MASDDEQEETGVLGRGNASPVDPPPAARPGQERPHMEEKAARAPTSPTAVAPDHGEKRAPRPADGDAGPHGRGCTPAAPPPAADAPGARIAGIDTENAAVRHADEEEGRDGPAPPPAAEDAVMRPGCADWRSTPGAYRVIGPNEENTTVYRENEETVFEGFLPPPSREDVIRREAEEMLRRAITLDESAVRPIADPTCATACEGPAAREDTEGACQKGLRSPVSFILSTLLMIAAIALGVAFGRAVYANEAGLSAATRSGGEDESCLEEFQDRHSHALLLFADITPVEHLEDATSPQGRALRWLVCHDQISSKLIDERDPSTGLLRRQAHGTNFGTDAGETQVRRRYALATFFFATTEGGPWNHNLNFLSPDEHECAWHHNYTRDNWQFGDFDPVGFVCLDEDNLIMLDDDDGKFYDVVSNFRVSNNLSGTIPPEFGRIDDLVYIMFENQRGLYGSLPSTIGNPPFLKSIAIQYSAPNFGGVLPISLFTNPSLEYISIQPSEGKWEFPPFIQFKPGENSSLLGLTVSSDWAFGGKGEGMSGTLPSHISEMRSLRVVNFAGGSLEGTIPDSLGSLGSLEFLSLHGNHLSGTLPRSFGQLSNLITAAFGGNNLGGLLPSRLGDLSNLRLLDLSYNEFEGTMPNTFSRLSSLEHISLQHNKNLNGSISAFEPLNHLSSLILHSNHFSSSIPEGLFSNFTNTIFADFGHNNFTGTLPQIFSQRASNISYLATMRNNFDAGAVDDVICEQVPVFFADCSSACSTYCCSEESTDKDHRSCNFDLDFYHLTYLACGEWWMDCIGEDVSYDHEPVDEWD